VTQHTFAACPPTSTGASSDSTTAGEEAIPGGSPAGPDGVAGGCPVSPLGYAAPPIPLGPDSLTWRYFGDWRGMLQGPWAGSMQNMHPQLGAAVIDHSTFFRERWPRLLRSLYPIGGVVFDGDRAPVTGAEVRDYHTDIKGVDEQGRRYHALNPEVFYWAHATFFVGTIHVAERFCGGLTEAQRRRLFDEHVEWYRMYGMSMRPVPACGPRSDRAAQTPIRPVASGLAVGRAAQAAGPVLRVAHRRSLRSAGARADGLPVVAPRRMAASAFRRLRPSRLRLRAKAISQPPAGARRLGSCGWANPGRLAAGADAGAQPAAAGRARHPEALLPEGLLARRPWGMTGGVTRGRGCAHLRDRTGARAGECARFRLRGCGSARV
jgi:uncharacterized protein (DUF2236 family)